LAASGYPSLVKKTLIKNTTMSVISLQVPDHAQASEFEIRMIVAVKLFEEGRLSSGQAANIVGLSKKTFLELLGKYGVSVFGYSFEELEDDLKHAS
jgi:predicted HTH domain antitoxin